MELVEALPAEVLQEEEALPVEVLQEEVLPEEAVHQEEALQEGDLPEENNHLRNKPKWHSQYPNRPDHATNQYVERKSKNSKETAPMPRNS